MPVVSVLIFAYNHELYIEQAILSVLEQDFKYDLSIKILYTHSVDRTESKILNAIENKGNAEIVYLNKETSFFNNVSDVISRDNSDYAIFLDGDDYWTYPLKLKQMVDFLEGNQEYSGVFHDVLIETVENPAGNNDQLNFYSGFKAFSQFNQYNQEYFPWDAINRIIIPPGSLLIRTEKLRERLNELIKIDVSGGWMMSLYLIKHSKFRYFNEYWSVYRNHTKGITKSRSHVLFVEANIKVLKTLLKDDYYKNIKWDIYKSLAKEHEFLMTSPENKNTSKRAKISILINILMCHWKVFFLQINRILKKEI